MLIVKDRHAPPLFTPFLNCAQALQIPIVQIDLEKDSQNSIVKRIKNKETHILFVGEFFSFSDYERLELATFKTGQFLINSTLDVRRSMLLDNYYPLIKDNTFPSFIIKENTEWKEVEEWQESLKNDYPLFYKNSIKSQKEKGLEACLIKDKKSLQEKIKSAKENKELLILREYVQLQSLHANTEHELFPKSREWRLFFYKSQLLDITPYWEERQELNAEEEKEIIDLSFSIAEKIRTPLIAIDVCQTKAKEWKIIEIGDPQFSGFKNSNYLKVINKLKEKIS